MSVVNPEGSSGNIWGVAVMSLRISLPESADQWLTDVVMDSSPDHLIPDFKQLRGTRRVFCPDN